ncbi:MAG: cadherin domain-containing protein, partial [Cyclobacteriaceae bacterium]
TATAGDSDYTVVSSQTLTFTGAAGETQTFTVSPAADQKLEADESLSASMSNLAGTTLAVGISDGAIITINNDDHAPVITTTQRFSIAEDAVNTTSVGTVIATDANTPVTFQNWMINSGNEEGIFSINSTSGELTVHDNALLDYEKLALYTLALTVSDGTNTSMEETIVVEVLDVNDNAPIITADQQMNIAEEAAVGTLVGSVIFTDADTQTTAHIWAIVSGNTDVDSDGKSAFTISGTGELTVQDSDDLSGDISFDLELTVSDGVNSSAAETVIIKVIKVNDAPSFIAGEDQTIAEDREEQTIVGWATAISGGPADESDQSLSFNLSNDNESLFSVQPVITSDGTLTYVPARDAFGTANVTVSLSDDGGTNNGGVDTSQEATFTITITPVNDAPVFTQGADQTIPAGAQEYLITGWATDISVGPADESKQQGTFEVSNDQNDFFTTQPAINSQGDLSFALADGVSGTATVTVRLADDGGTANGGIDISEEASFAISIGKLPQVISLDAIEDRKIGQDPIALQAAGGNSGNPVTYRLVTEPALGVAYLEDNLLVMEGVGTVTVIASQAGNSMYEAADEVSVIFSVKQNELFLPTLFSPNGDQSNDYFILRGAGGVASIELSIFNREGEAVYQSTNFEHITQTGWDGTYQGKFLTPDNYVWVLKGRYTNGDPLLVQGKTTGTIRLIR